MLRVTCPLQTSPDSERGFPGIWERRRDGTQALYARRHHWTFTDRRDRVGQRQLGPGRLSEAGHLRADLLSVETRIGGLAGGPSETPEELGTGECPFEAARGGFIT